MATISHVVKKSLDSKPTLQESMIEGVINFSNLADRLQSEIEADLGKECNRSAIIMALRRYSEQLQSKTLVKKPFKVYPEITMRSDICDICLVKTPSAMDKIKDIYRRVDSDKGETINVIQGNYEITIVISQKYLGQLKQKLRSEKILNIEKDLVSLTLSLTKEFLHTPGILSFLTRKLAWSNINIVENISTMTELIFIISEKDAVRAYNTFQEMIKEHSGEILEK